MIDRKTVPASRRQFLKTGIVPVALIAAPQDRGASARPQAPETSVAQVGLNVTELRERLALACRWITDVAQMKSDDLGEVRNTNRLPHKHWKGALRGEYTAATRTWDMYSPNWHTAQGIKALVWASKVLEDKQLLDAARLSADFIRAERVSDRSHKHYGLIFGYENLPEQVNTSAVLSCVDPLFVLSDATGEREYADWALAAASWVARNTYLGDGLFHDCFDVNIWKCAPPPWKSYKPGRPLVDDEVFLTTFKRTNDPQYRKIFFACADRLLKEEDPPGNWINFIANDPKAGSFHPRQAYWWAYPLLAAYRESGHKKYLACARRGGEWYIKAMRSDGGLMGLTYRDFSTPSFGHATSGIACACILWHGLWKETREDRWAAAMNKALKFCMMMQFREKVDQHRGTADPNLLGSVLEKVLPPDGSDRSPYHLRDLATIFFIQAVARLFS
jgi:hypothetical protein